MSNNPFDRQLTDLGIKYIPPLSPTDPRVPLAEEFTLGAQISIELFRSGRKNGWSDLPKITVSNQNRLRITGTVALRINPQPLNIDTQIVLPPIGNTTAIIRQDDFLSLVGLAAEVGEAQDPLLGQVGFRYRDPVANTIQSIEKENARRYRAFWLLTISSAPITPQDVSDVLSLESNSDRRLAITSKNEAGFLLSTNLRLFAMDANWAAGLAYSVIPDSIEVLPIGAILRAINFQEEGYTYGYQQEEAISPLFVRYLASPLVPKESISLARERLLNICQGIPGNGFRYKRTVKNLTAGQFGGNPGKAGESSSAPNGSVCLGNDQRISFTNQGILQTLGVAVVTAGSDGSGKALVATGLNTNAPQGSAFSENRADHKIYGVDGLEQSSLGKFSDLGGSGSLQWIAGENSTIVPGDQVYFVSGVKYLSGSGFDIPFSQIEKAWISGLEISVSNIRYGATQDLAAYEAPANNELYFVIFGTERAAIHYIYKKISVSANSLGIATIPSNERGCFAFINGVLGRVDAPVVKGLQPNQTYQALCYYPPRSLETWQFQMLYAQYQGLGSSQNSFLDGAVVATEPLVFFHSSGGGLSVHRTGLIDTVVAMHLPQIPNATIKSYEFDTPIQFLGETYPGPVTWREASLISAPGLTLPSPGQILQIRSNPGIIYPKSLSVAILTNGQILGGRVPPLTSGKPYQVILAFVVNKNHDSRLVIATFNAPGSQFADIALDSSKETALDVFDL